MLSWSPFPYLKLLWCIVFYHYFSQVMLYLFWRSDLLYIVVYQFACAFCAFCERVLRIPSISLGLVTPFFMPYRCSSCTTCIQYNVHALRATAATLLRTVDPQCCWRIILGLEHTKNTNPKLQTHTQRKRDTKIYEVQQDPYISGAEERDLLMIYIRL